MPKNHKILTEYPIGKTIRHYALPAVMGLLFYGIQNVIDGVIVGRFIGTDALAGVNLIMPLYSAIAVIAIMTGVGSQATIGISMGEKNIEKAKNAITSGAIFVFICCLILSIPALLFSGTIISALGADTQLASYSMGYMRGLLIFSPFIALMFYSDCMLKVSGHPRYAFAVMAVTIVINTFLNIFFIKVFSMGTLGVGLATGGAFAIGSVMGSFILFNSKNTISMLSGKFKLKILKEILYNGSSEGMNELAIGISLLIFNYTLMKYVGADGVAAFTVINYICFLGTTIFLGISDGIIPIISYNYGAGNLKRIRKVLKLTAKINLTVGIAIFTILILFSGKLVMLFLGDDDTQILKMAITGASIYSFSFLIEGLNILLSSYYTALAKAKYSLIIALLRGLVFIALGLWILPMFLGITGIWLTVPIAEFLTFLVALFIYRLK